MGIFSKLFSKAKESDEKTSSARSLFQRPLDEFIRILDQKTAGEEPATLALTLIALKNMKIAIAVGYQSNEDGRSEKLPHNDISFGELAWSELQKDHNELNERRLYWFMSAAMLCYASRCVVAGRGDQEVLARVWKRYLDSTKFLQHIVAHNILWSEEEKIWYSHFREERQFLSDAIENDVPRGLWALPSFNCMLEKQGFEWLADKYLVDRQQAFKQDS